MTRITLMVDPDISPLGYERERPVSEYPRRFSSVSLPFAWPYVGSLTIPAKMSADEWERMLEVIEVMRPAFVEGNP